MITCVVLGSLNVVWMVLEAKGTWNGVVTGLVKFGGEEDGVCQ